MTNIATWLFIAVTWSSAFMAIKIAVESVSPADLVAGRMVVGTAVVLAVVALLKRPMPGTARDWLVAGVAGITGNILPFTLISHGEMEVDSGVAALLMGIAPVVTVFLAPLFDRRDRLSGRAMMGVALGLAGLVVLFGPEVLGKVGGAPLGQLAILGAALSYAFTALFVRRFNRLEPLSAAAGSMIVGTVLAVLLALLDPGFQGVPVVEGEAALAVVYLGLFPTALATFAYFFLLPRIGPGSLQQVNFVVPVLGALLGVLVLGERPAPQVFVSLAMIALAVGLVTWPRRKKA